MTDTSNGRPLTIVNCIKGGLGNQLFQHVFARGLARKLNAEVVSDLSHFDIDAYSRHPQKWLLGAMPNFGTVADYAGDGCYQIDDGSIDALDSPISLPANIRALVLTGYWQKEELLVQTVVKEARDLLAIEAVRLVDAALVARLKACENSVAVHIRRHDYGHHGLCKASYYYASIQHIQAEFPNAQIFVFSDEPNYARHLMLTKALQCTMVASGSDVGDLYLMSLCKHFVIANSSFSWWGAYFGEAKGGRIFCPKEWVTIGRLASPCPTRWLNVKGAVAPFLADDEEVENLLASIRAQLISGATPEKKKSFSNNLDLTIFFRDMPEYVVIKLPDHFPNYYDYQDIDIICRDVDLVDQHIQRIGQFYVNQGFRIVVRQENSHSHVDFYAPSATRLNFRFDLISSLAVYEKFQVDPIYHRVVLDSRQKIVVNGASVFVPAEEHELSIRCMEYLEWHETIPSKSKHLDYIMAKNNNKFLPVLSRYTNLVIPEGLVHRGVATANPALLESDGARYDYLMIWGHGLQYTSQILQIIRSDSRLKIISVVKRDVENMEQFVKDVYACDTVPFEHLVAKTKYLLTTPAQILFVLVQNLDPQEAFFGEGAFRHIQSKRIKEVKENIRNKFNPRKESGERTEYHVIHASDYPSQVEHGLSILGLPPLAHYQVDPHPSIDAPYHLGKLSDVKNADVSVVDLYASILDQGLVPIKDTPHYQFVNGNRSPYIEYHSNNFGTRLTDDHWPESFDQKIKNFQYGQDLENGRKNLILVAPLPRGGYQILDGVHRAAILASNGSNSIVVALMPSNNV
jgi:hypothetical protein